MGSARTGHAESRNNLVVVLSARRRSDVDMDKHSARFRALLAANIGKAMRGGLDARSELVRERLLVNVIRELLQEIDVVLDDQGHAPGSRSVRLLRPVRFQD